MRLRDVDCAHACGTSVVSGICIDCVDSAGRRAVSICGNLLILRSTQEGTVPHRDKPARIPWPQASAVLCVCTV
eukprot:5737296-Prymnesium_polylepis.1